MTAAIFPTNHGFGAFGPVLEPQFDVRFGPGRPSHSVYVRRRLVAGLVTAFVISFAGLAAHSALADRGGVPASTPAIRSASAAVGDGAPVATAGAGTASASASASAVSSAVVASTYLVQGGDTLWSIAQRFHGSHGVSSYVDKLVSANHGTALQPGQLLTLP